jgi:hypothetical protein
MRTCRPPLIRNKPPFVMLYRGTKQYVERGIVLQLTCIIGSIFCFAFVMLYLALRWLPTDSFTCLILDLFASRQEGATFFNPERV